MLRALIYLRVMSAWNWLRSRAQRLRQPKYLFGAIVGAAYFYFFFIRSFAGPPRPRDPQAMAALDAASLAIPANGLLVASAAGALLLLLIVAIMWIVPTQRAALGFTEAEIAFLFPAPVTRRSLVHFRLLSSQFRSLVGAALMVLFTNRWSFLGGNALTHAIGWWFIFSALNLHFSGANFTLSRLADRGIGPWRRRLLVCALVAAAIGITFFRLPVDARWPAPLAAPSLQPLAYWLVGLTETAPLSWLLWPLKTVLGPFLAADGRAFLLILPSSLLVISVHYLWVVRSAVSFEDAAVDDAQRRAAQLTGWRAPDRSGPGRTPAARKGPFRLAGVGRPELAFFWKNLLSTWPYFTGRVFLIGAGLILASVAWLRTQPIAPALLPATGAVAAAFAVYVLIVGPQFARQDLRGDLSHTDVLKTYPLPGWQIVLGELLTPVAILTGVLWLALLSVALTFPPPGRDWVWLTPPVRIVGTLGLAVIMPALVSLQLLVPNAAALFFSGWFQTTRNRGGGPEVVGQRMIFFFAQTLTMVAALIPAALAGAVPFAIAFLLGQQGTLALALSSVASAGLILAVLVAEIATGVRLLGARFEQLDLSAELRP